MTSSSDSRFMAEALRLAREMMHQLEGGPFGAILVKDDQIIARGWNRVTSTNDPTAHAEIVAIREGCRALGSFSLPGCTLYVNCEPCPMCLAACYWAGIERIVHAATREDAAALGFADAMLYDELCLEPGARSLGLEQLSREDALQVFAEWETLPGKVMY